MYCNSINFINFRNLQQTSVSFQNGVNVITGENAQGKTNIMEGIYLFARGKSFRSSRDDELVSFGQKITQVNLTFSSPEHKNNSILSLQYEKNSRKNNRKIFFSDGVKADRTADIIGKFRAVLFCPENLSLISGPPSVRRSFIDIAISQLKPLYIAFLSRYNAILRERNALLKSAQQNSFAYTSIARTLDIYSEQLAASAASISKIRDSYIRKLQTYVSACFDIMTGHSESVSVIYKNGGIADPDFSDEKETADKFMRLYSENQDREIRAGTSLFGIHRDEIDIAVNGRPARLFGSQGQRRSVALALKLAEGDISNDITGEYPVFLLDDVLSELDLRRRSFILGRLSDRQVIVSSCENELFSSVPGVNIIRVADGRIIQ